MKDPRRAPARAVGVLALALLAPLGALADGPSPSGVAVVACPGAEAPAWDLAQEVYAHPSLRPASLDERRARVLVGAPAGPDAPAALVEIADERSGVHGEDGASRALLRMLASQLAVRAIVIVEPGATGEPVARVFLADTGSFDAARYAPDAAVASADAGAAAVPIPASTSDASADGAVAVAPVPPLRWTGAAASLDRSFAAQAAVPPPPPPPPPLLSAPALATSPLPPEKPKAAESHPFYTSPWFWGAVGAAAFGGTAVYFATRDNSTGTIHLQLQVPK